MKVKIVKIGNSRGIRLPHAVLEHCGFGDEAELEVEGGAVRLTPAAKSRAGWEEAFAEMAASGEDAPLLGDAIGLEGDDKDWTW